jgi:hypothetical protein
MAQFLAFDEQAGVLLMKKGLHLKLQQRGTCKFLMKNQRL